MTRAGLVVAALSAAALVTGACEQEPEVPTRPDEADASDWCAGHGVPESMCTVCHPDLVALFKEAGDFCAGHGYPESVCPLCHPLDPPAGVPRPEGHGGHGEHDEHGHGEHEGEQDDEHGHGEHEGEQDDEHGNGEGGEHEDEAGEHAEAGAADEHADQAAADPDPPFPAGTRIRFRSAEIESAAGLGTAPATDAALGVGVEATARLEYDRNRYAEVTAQVPGIVREVHADLGDEVEAGQVLFTLESVQVGGLQARLRAARERASAARAHLERQRALGDVASRRAVELARQEQEAANAELRAMQSSLRMAGTSRGGGRVGLTAPIAGTLVRRPGVVGMHATASEPLAAVADTARTWALLDVRDADAAAVRVGQPISLHIDGLPGRTFRGEVTWVASEVDPRTRTVAVRAEIPNESGHLRANLFGRARIRVHERQSSVAVPRDAVQRVDRAHVVFVRLGEGLYEPRVVELGRSGDGVVQVLGELEPGEPVVTRGAYLLKTELMRDSIGAGCCEIEGAGE